jgi:acyl-CoA synthetase (NDP forming)
MPRRLLSEAKGYNLLKSAGIPVSGFGIATTAVDAVKAADTIGYPVVMKVISQHVVHKSDAGGVIINIKSPEEATAAFEKISRDTKGKVRSPHPLRGSLGRLVGASLGRSVREDRLTESLPDARDKLFINKKSAEPRRASKEALRRGVLILSARY